jgi:hypothetical protein
MTCGLSSTVPQVDCHRQCSPTGLCSTTSIGLSSTHLDAMWTVINSASSKLSSTNAMWTVIDSASIGLSSTMFANRTIIDNFNRNVIDTFAVIDKRNVDCHRQCLKWTVIDNVLQPDCHRHIWMPCGLSSTLRKGFARPSEPSATRISLRPSYELHRLG